jgi:hypothetical protein
MSTAELRLPSGMEVKVVTPGLSIVKAEERDG